MMSRPILVEVRSKYQNEPIETLIKRFNKKVKKEGVIEKYLEKKYYEKPSNKRRKERERRRKLLQKVHKEHNSIMNKR